MPLSAEVRRLVTYVNDEGKAVALFDGDNPHKRVRPQRGTVSRLLWMTAKRPRASTNPWTGPRRRLEIAPPRGGSIFRIVDLPPITPDVEALPVDYHASQHGDSTPKRHMPPRHPLMHATRTIDYAIIMEGEVDMLLDDSEVHLKAGDVVVQQARTTHGSIAARRLAASPLC